MQKMYRWNIFVWENSLKKIALNIVLKIFF